MPLLAQGIVVQERWEVVQKIGEGQFSEVYQVLELGTQEQVKGPGRRRSLRSPLL